MPVHQIPPSRRQFLHCCALTGGALLIGDRACASADKVDPNRFVLMADTHIHANLDHIKNDVNMAANFRQAAQEICALSPKPAGIMVAGDCVYIEGRKKDYAGLLQLAAIYQKADLPVHWIMGNHDNRENFVEAFPTHQSKQDLAISRHCSVLDSPNATWIFLDSLQKTNHTPGRLNTKQLAWLAQVLDERPDKPALLMMHHYPEMTKKDNGLKDSQALLECIVPRKQVKAWIYGHSHRWAHREHEGIHLLNLPAVAWLFDDKQPRGWVDAQLQKDGALFTPHALDPSHPKHLKSLKLSWRKA